MSAKEEAIAAATASLKKILSAKGDLQGNFYAYVGKSDAAMAVTLVALDPKGAKALNYGRALKKEIAGGKFLRGSVTFDSDAKKLIFIPGPGNLSGKLLQKQFKTGFDDSGLARFTKRAMIDMSAANALKAPDEREDVADESEAIEDSEINELGESKTELDDLIGMQGELGALHVSLGAFLKNQSDENATRDLIQAGVTKISQLTDESAGLNAFAIEKEFTELVGFTRVGDDPFGGDSVPPEVGLLMEHAGTLMNTRSEGAKTTYQTRLAPIFLKADQILTAIGTKILTKAVGDHNVKVPEDEAATVPVILATRYEAAREVLYKKFIPPDIDALTDGSWEKGFLQLVREKGPDELEDVTLIAELNGLQANADQTRVVTFDDSDGDITDPKAFHKTVCSSDWNTVKKKLSEEPVKMWQMVLYRKRVVDGLLGVQRATYSQLLAKSVGSQNLTSDYDLTLSTRDGSGDEIRAVKGFNDAVKADYGKQPGVVFDTNLYAKDFLKVKDTVFGTGESDGGDIAEVTRYLEMDRSDQDVAALTKMRQYMTPEEWEAYCEEFEDDDKTKIQLQEVDAKYHMKLNTVLEGLIAGYKATVADVNNDVVADLAAEKYIVSLNTLKLKADTGDVEALEAYQALTEKVVEWFNHHFEDLTLEIRNDIYLEKMGDVRAVQTLHSNLEALLTLEVNPMKVVAGELATLAEVQDPDQAKQRALKILNKYIGDPQLLALLSSDIPRFISLAEGDPSGGVALSYIVKKIDALKEEARRKLGEANYYAAEAYLSEGPLQHIVNGKQSDNPEVFAKLKPEHFLESINEQTGDFFKDVSHHAGDQHLGVAFYQTAKYLQRMFEGIVKLSLKDGLEDIETQLTMPGGWGSASAMMGLIDTNFMPIRGSKGEYASMNEKEKSDAALKLLPTVYGGSIKTIGDLKGAVMTLSKSLNAEVRKIVSMRPDSKSGATTLGMQSGT
jgi:hypothetical protein